MLEQPRATSATPDAGHVLVVDDDPTVREVVGRYLSRAGYRVTACGDGDEGLRLARQQRPDLIVLDLMLPGRSGLQVCTELRLPGAVGSQVPIIMLTALGEEEDRVAGLEIGADDYVTKPFSPRELVLRISSVLRRSRDVSGPPSTRPALRDGDLEVDVAARRATIGGRDLALTIREFDLLAFMIAHPGQAFGRAELLERVWGWSFGDASTVTVHVRRLREKVEQDPTAPRRICTVWGVGYRYDQVSAHSESESESESKPEPATGDAGVV